MSIEKFDDKDGFLEALEHIRPDLMFPETMSGADVSKGVEHLRPSKIKTGMITSIPMYCKGQRCVFAQSCPLLADGINPEGGPCPIEMAAAVQFFNDYVNELAVDTSRMVETSIVRELVDQEIQQMRKTWILSQEHFIQENPVGIDSDGNVIVRKELHQAIDYEDRILKRKEKLRAQLMATREAQAKLGQGTLDNARAVANLVDQYRDISRERDKLLRAQLGMEHHDAYIEEDDIADAEVVEEPDQPWDD